MAALKNLRITGVTDWFTMYLTLGIVNTIELYASDEAGNRSAPATMTIDLRVP